MRREWSGWIKNRQWAEFEQLAKTDPSQPLADTVAELERGFPDKPDRKALRKVLFLLAQSGFEPSEIDSDTEPDPAPAEPFSMAFMVSPDAVGDTVITVGKEDRGRVTWLVAHIHAHGGVSRASEDTASLEEAHATALRFRKLHPSPAYCAEVPVEFALQRLARAVAGSKSVPPAMAYWRASLPTSVLAEHPADSLPRPAATKEDLGEMVLGRTASIPWRLEIGAVAPALSELMEQRARGETATLEKDDHGWDVALTASRSHLFIDDLVADQRAKLLDLAYVLHLKSDPEYANVLALADDLRDLRADSVFARAMTTKTLLILVNTLKERNEASKSEPSGGTQR